MGGPRPLDLPKYEAPITYPLPSSSVAVYGYYCSDESAPGALHSLMLTSGTITMENYTDADYAFSIDIKFETDAQEPIAFTGRYDVSGCKKGQQCIVDD
jgi:hypothetical protein